MEPGGRFPTGVRELCVDSCNSATTCELDRPNRGAFVCREANFLCMPPHTNRKFVSREVWGGRTEPDPIIRLIRWLCMVRSISQSTRIRSDRSHRCLSLCFRQHCDACTHTLRKAELVNLKRIYESAPHLFRCGLRSYVPGLSWLGQDSLTSTPAHAGRGAPLARRLSPPRWQGCRPGKAP